MPNTFVVQEVNAPLGERRDEPLGTKSKFWFDNSGKLTLFKKARPNSNEDWSEKAAEQCAHLLGIPCAEVELARCSEALGTVSTSFLEHKQGDILVHGNELLSEFDLHYPAQQRYRHSLHTLGAVRDALERLKVGPPVTPQSVVYPQEFDGIDVFVGYLLFDAWIGNSDRHHENWGAIRRGQSYSLAPSFDHASSLGRNETIERAEKRLVGSDPRVTVELYVSKCKSALYADRESEKPLSPFAALIGFSESRPRALEFWLNCLSQILPEQVYQVFEQFPPDRQNDTHRRFALRILEVNRRHLLEISQ